MLMRPTADPLTSELPIFCERCGYSLHGLKQQVCEQCAIRHFACPECGHHQPINTLRPVFQKLLGRVSGVVLAGVVMFKVGLFVLMLIAWFAMGVEWAYSRRWTPGPMGGITVGQLEWRWEAMVSFGLLALAYGIVARLQLLRWRNAVVVGVVLAWLAAGAAAAGAWIDQLDRGYQVSPWGEPFMAALLLTFLLTLAGAIIASPIWTGLVRLFLPRATADRLLRWQHGDTPDGTHAAALGR